MAEDARACSRCDAANPLVIESEAKLRPEVARHVDTEAYGRAVAEHETIVEESLPPVTVKSGTVGTPGAAEWPRYGVSSTLLGTDGGAAAAGQPAQRSTGFWLRITGGAFALFLILILAMFFIRSRSSGSGDVAQDSATVDSQSSNASSGGGETAGNSPANSSTTDAQLNPNDIDNSNSANANIEGQLAVLTIYSNNVDEMTVMVDGRTRGVVSNNQPLTMRLIPGDHFVRVVRPGYEPWQRQVSLAAGATQPLSVISSQTPDAVTPQELAQEHQRNAQRLFDNRQYAQALAEVRQGLLLDPGNQSLRQLKNSIESASKTTIVSAPSPTPRPTERTGREEQPQPQVQAQSQPTPRPQPQETPFTQNQASGPLVPARVLRRVEPDYPRQAYIARIQGSVAVQVTLDESGRVIDARAVSGAPELQAAAVAAARRCSYSPASRGSQPVSGGRVLIVFSFSIL